MKRILAGLVVTLVCGGAAFAVTDPAETPPAPYDAEPGDLPVPPDSERWERMRETYMRRLTEMRRKTENEDDGWNASAPAPTPASGGKKLDPNVILERTDPQYPLLSFQFGLVRTGPALKKAMGVLQKKQGDEAVAEVASILRDAVRQAQRAESDPELLQRFNTEEGGTFEAKLPNGVPSQAAVQQVVEEKKKEKESHVEEVIEGPGLPPSDQPLGALLQPPAQQPPPSVKAPAQTAPPGPTTQFVQGNQAAATKAALQLAEKEDTDTGKLREAISGAENQASPLLLDLNGNGVADTTTEGLAFNARGSVWFDVSGKGVRRRTEWVKPGQDGLLVLDANGNGVCDSASELFGDTDGFADGYAKLALLDADRDGAIAGAELEHLRVWVDDGDGTCEAREMSPVAALGITRLGLRHERYVGSFVRDGRACRMWDWFPHHE